MELKVNLRNFCLPLLIVLKVTYILPFLCGIHTRTCYEIPLVSSQNALAYAYVYELHFERHCSVVTFDSWE